MAVNTQDLYWSRAVSNLQWHDFLKSDESVVTQAMQPMIKPADAIDFYETMIRTASVFVLGDEVMPGIESCDDMPIPFQLPPLPFPRMWIEIWSDMDGHGKGFELQEQGCTMVAWAISEVERGAKWDVVVASLLWSRKDHDEGLMYIDTDAMTTPGLAPMRITPETVYFPSDDDGGEWVVEKELSIAATVVEMLHYITSIGTDTVEEPIGRGIRRAYSRKTKGWKHPQVYKVKLTNSVRKEGHSDREFHCRWMVRGHWRHYRDGTKTWVKAYIKGPAGAPWRGRPIYTDERGKEAA